MTTRRRAMWWLLAGSVVGAVLVTLGLTWLLRLTVRETQQERIHAETAMLAGWVETHPADEPQELSVRTAERLGLRITLIAATGRVLGDSARDRDGVARMENHLERPEIRAALRQGSGIDVRRSNTTSVDYLYCAWLVDGAGPIKFARVALPMSQVEAGVDRFGGLVLAVMLISVLVMSTLAYALIRGLSKPVERVSRQVERIAAGELEHDLPEQGRDEIYRLAVAVNRMKRTLVARLADFQGEQQRLASVISGMHEGLLMVDTDRRVQLANDAVREILQLQVEPTGQLLGEAVRQPAVIRDVEVALTEGREVHETVMPAAATGRVFELHVTPIHFADRIPHGALVMFFDITRLEALEGVRREFVADVSHELRTPLTAIKAAVETIAAGDPEDRENTERFLAIVQKHADRMGALIEDLTDLSLIETGACTLDLQDIDVGELIREVVDQFEPRAQAADVRLIVEVPRRLTLSADRGRIEQVLTNLIDNAVKFNRKGGEVRIRGERVAGTPSITIEDTGSGIPAGSLDRVFHRFYRVDADRSRQAGGTGLGLAIVKHLMRLHGGTVSVESELSRGARFSLRF